MARVLRGFGQRSLVMAEDIAVCGPGMVERDALFARGDHSAVGKNPKIPSVQAISSTENYGGRIWSRTFR